MKIKTENYKSLYISEFNYEKEPLYCATLETLNTITRIRYGFESVDLCYIERWENLPRPCNELLRQWLDPWNIDADLREELFPETI